MTLKCHELRLVECGVKLESVLVYSFDGVADGLIFERGGGGRGEESPGAIKMVTPHYAISLSFLPPPTRAKISTFICVCLCVLTINRRAARNASSLRQPHVSGPQALAASPNVMMQKGRPQTPVHNSLDHL